MKKNLILFFIITLLVGCSNLLVHKNEDNIFREYTESLGYKFIKYEGVLETYILDKELLIKEPFTHDWGLQDVNPTDYLDKEIEVHRVVADHHPLEQVYSNIESVYLIFFVVDNEIIGGLSYPKPIEPSDAFMGGSYTLHGETFEEKVGTDYSTWYKKFIEEINEHN